VKGLEESVKFDALDRLKQNKLKPSADRPNMGKSRESAND
jgi:hypothetical protein